LVLIHISTWGIIEGFSEPKFLHKLPYLPTSIRVIANENKVLKKPASARKWAFCDYWG